MSADPAAVIEALERRLAELTAELEAARDARERAEHSSRARDAFLAAAAHDLRNPLNAIAGWAHLLRDMDPSTPKFRAALEAIAANVKLQARQIDELADIANLAATGLRVSLVPLDLKPLVEAVCRSAAEAAGQQGVELVPPRSRAAPVLADTRRIEQILTDLLGHALAASPPGGRVEVELATGDLDVAVEVTAPSATVSQEQIAELFELFAVPDPRSRRSGPRLSIARAIAELHGGALEAGPCPEGRGLRFRLRLPLEATDDEP